MKPGSFPLLPVWFARHPALVFALLCATCVPGLPLTARAQPQNADIPALIGAGQLAQARSAVEQQLQSRPKDAQLLLYKGVIQRESGQTRDALLTFTQLSNDRPDLPEPWNNLAAIYAAQGQFEQARAALEKALHTHPSYATAYDNLGAIYARLASLAYSRALLIDAEGSVPNAKPSPQQQAANEALKQSLQQPMQLALLREVRELPPRPTPAPATVASAPAPARPPAPGVVAAATPVPQAATTPVAPAQLAAAPIAPAPAPMPAALAPQAVAPKPAPAPATPPPAVPAANNNTPAATVATTTTPASANEAAISQAVRAWAQAWSDRDVNRYLAAYAPEFQLPGGQGRAAWEQGRRSLILGKKYISVQLTELQVNVDQRNGARAVARFVQDYKADTYTSINRKTLELVEAAGRWLIVREAAGN